MSEWHPQVVQIGKVGKHPHADKLEITQVLGNYPCIMAKGQFKPGDLAAYVPVDTMVPVADARFAFLGADLSAEKTHARVKAKKLRGIFSMGLLVPAPEGMQPGADIVEPLGLSKYVAPQERNLMAHGVSEAGPDLPVYDLESLRRYPDILQVGELVSLTEKIHGMNARFYHDGTRFWCGSRTQYKRKGFGDAWWKVVEAYQLEEKLAAIPGICVLGEVYGPCQDLHYDSPDKLKFAAFDALNVNTGLYLHVDEFQHMMEVMRIPTVPELCRGEWWPSMVEHAEGKSTLPGADHVREGFVVKPLHERWHAACGRVALKMVGEGYQLRKEAI